MTGEHNNNNAISSYLPTLSQNAPNVHLRYGILVRKYKNVIKLQKGQENPLK
jgi:hypothetical protein